MPSQRNSKPLPEVFIDKTEVNIRVKNFMEHKHGLLTTAIGKNESKSAWYSLEQFEQVMRELYYQNADGMRIYFGAYPDDNSDYARQLTIIFVPTFYNENTGKHTDIIIDDDESFGDRGEPLEMQSMSIRKNLDTFGLCPPSCYDQDCVYPYNE